MASCLQRNHEWSASASYSSTGATTDRWRQRWQCWAMCLVPSLLAWCVYVNSLDGEFVHDDLSAITTNRDVIGASPSAWDFLRNDFWGTALVDPRSHKSYRPLTVLTFKWNYALSGLNPWSYHVTNVALHCFVSCLFAWTCHFCLGVSRLSALLSASLFAIHPIHTEAVSGVVGRADLLTTLFFLLSFVVHDRAISGASWPRSKLTLMGLVLALLALAAKENGIATLPVTIAWNMVRLSSKPSTKWRSSWSTLRRAVLHHSILVLILTTVLLLLARLLLLRGHLPAFSEQDNPAVFASNSRARVLTLLYLPVFNMGLLLAPIRLSYDYTNGSIPLIEHYGDWRNAATLLFYTVLLGALLYSWIQRKQVVLWSIAVMILPMLPASNLFYAVGFVVAERLLYLPSLGYCLMVGHGIRIALGGAGWWDRRIHQPTATAASWRLPGLGAGGNVAKIRTPQKKTQSVLWLCSMALAMCAVAASFGAKTWTRNAEWFNRQTLFTSGLRTLPNNAKMNYNYANLLKDQGHLEASISYYREAIKLWPTYASAHNNLATVLLARAEEQQEQEHRLGNRKGGGGNSERLSIVREAERHFWMAIQSHPHHVRAHYNLAILSLQKDDKEEALRLLKRCLSFSPNHREALDVMAWLVDDPTSTPRYHSTPAPPTGLGFLNLGPSLREYHWNETARN